MYNTQTIGCQFLEFGMTVAWWMAYCTLRCTVCVMEPNKIFWARAPQSRNPARDVSASPGIISP